MMNIQRSVEFPWYNYSNFSTTHSLGIFFSIQNQSIDKRDKHPHILIHITIMFVKVSLQNKFFSCNLSNSKM